MESNITPKFFEDYCETLENLQNEDKFLESIDLLNELGILLIKTLRQPAENFDKLFKCKHIL